MILENPPRLKCQMGRVEIKTRISKHRYSQCIQIPIWFQAFFFPHSILVQEKPHFS